MAIKFTTRLSTENVVPETPITPEVPIGYVHSIETFGSVDGPGIRFVAFLQGCRMRCEFCHNPDTWNIGSGEAYTADELIAKALPYKAFWGKDGGITCSGGESLIQIDFLIDLFKKCKAQGINTCLDTCGQPFTYKEPFFSKFKELMKYTDLSMVDIKHIDPAGHKKLTGFSNEHILEMIEYMSNHGHHMWIRHVLIPERTDYDEYLTRLGDYIQTLNNVDRVEVLPYHTMGIVKYEKMGIKYPLAGIEPPTHDRVVNAERLLHTADYPKQQR
ncbi:MULTISPECIES: pyruvate formate-lyase-activating protein [Latilactobacillus]|uniref:Pyruvate formate-lyase-activating enzyme n=1 Tax=Latilactobacillus curvatus TaxID=28038 RepID=A0AAJ5URY2_LATCU|nr:pyruvate formate-lyase-activating protein [Latilactobacillus curvatus]MDT3393999.1 pyruvate formate lyase-activating protein [Bacillota bacterium]ASN61890.1 pyruvate formate lyase-activating protein [Latilactobacillus curvatus]AWV72993.1 pyruvate formate lyase-activating protein [Latilactobacillus curvatus]AZP96360.1 pyruvate formate lyase-activating protein [Latilactobacillus curvatus]EHE85119.1 pyruvate formate-lyase 1-activating enzyme [Latilactobacillus curvatus CRL 705]